MQSKNSFEIEIFGKNRKLEKSAIFTSDGIDQLIKSVRSETINHKSDVTTKEGKAEIKSLAAKVAKCKAPIKNLAKELKEDSQKLIKTVNSEYNRYEIAMDQLRDEIRKPLDEIEAKEAKELKDRQDRLAEIERLSTTRSFDSVSDLKGLVLDLKQAYDFEWGDFEFIAKTSFEKAKKYLESEIERGMKYEADQLELRKLREESEKRAKKDREERIAKEAVENAKIELEAEKKRIEQAKIVAEKQAQEARELLQKQEDQAEENRLIAVKMAVKEEQERVEEKRVADEAEKAKIAANKKHRIKINNEVCDKIIEAAGDEPDVFCLTIEKIVDAISAGQIPHITINY